MYDDIRDENRFWNALWETDDEPYGTARSARSEALVGTAERLGRDDLTAWALVHLIKSYNYGGESPKGPVAMSRLLRLYDERPGAFDERLTHSLFWHLKWITSSLMAVPEVPLATIRGYQAEMERRYRAAGHSLRPVHQSAFYLARHVGDDDEARRRFAAWLAADRDTLSDCDACERREQGRWLVRQSDDAGALELFAPTLAGSRTCAEEPQLTLSTSMIPLLRLGRTDEARSHHLRGYRLVRGKVSTYDTVAEHIEFCALTGNEGRGVEILAEHRAWLAAPHSDLLDHLGYLEGATVLLRRLAALGRGDVPVADVPGTDGTAGALLARCEAEIAGITARFDARNGTDAVTTRTRERLERAPLIGSLRLGLRSVIPAPTGPVPEAAPAVGPASDEESSSAEPTIPADLKARAESLDERGHPDASRAWQRYFAALDEGRVPSTEEDLGHRATRRAHDLATEGDRAGAARAYDEAAARFRAARLPGRALAAEARAQYARLVAALVQRHRAASEDAEQTVEEAELVESELADALPLGESVDSDEVFVDELVDVEPVGGVDATGSTAHVAADAAATAPSTTAAPVDRVAMHADFALLRREGASLLAARQATAREYLVILTCAAAAAVNTVPVDNGPDRADALDRLDALCTELREAAREHDLPNREIEAEEMAAQADLARGRHDDAVEHLRAAVAVARAADRPWPALGPLATLGSVLQSHGRVAEAEPAFAEAVEVARAYPDPRFPLGQLLVDAANCASALDRIDDAMTRASAAADWFDTADDPAMAANCRLTVANWLRHQDRVADAVAYLEELLPDVDRYLDPPTALRAHWMLGTGLARTGEPAPAAEQLVLAAGLAETHAPPETRAEIASEAAHALSLAGRRDAAEAAFGAALAQLRGLGLTGDAVRMLRASAWNLVDGRESRAPDEHAELVRAAVARFNEAFALLDAAPADTQDLDRAHERVQTEWQLAQILWNADEDDEALRVADRAAARLELTLPRFESEYAQMVELAARVEHHVLDMPALAAARLDDALLICRTTRATKAADHLTRLRTELA
ncbi:hypothetical protein [Yinghuangia seranimata]|uniref:hypothetical protein n=1 Tax=Yinghuangia seranimata TaxID=408067 RepID=UPI00248BB280|nr:hypothetical protein [Yinghuangia seranimata]MDI2132274.1 hypothetical protein [Yinghuangia seranimata]